jgi:hypothetical protein
MSSEVGTGITPQEAQASALNKRLETIAWGCFLIMIGGLGLVPEEQVPEGVWLIGVGIIWLGLNYVRYLNHVKMSNATIILGILAIVGGVGDYLGVDVPVLGLLLILLGLNLIYKHAFEDKPARS